MFLLSRFHVNSMLFPLLIHKKRKERRKHEFNFLFFLSLLFIYKGKSSVDPVKEKYVKKTFFSKIKKYQ